MAAASSPPRAAAPSRVPPRRPTPKPASWPTSGPSWTTGAANALTQRGLTRVGDLLNNFSGQIAGAVNGFVHTQVHRIVTGPRFANLWVQVNRTVHAQLVKALSGQGNGAITISNNQVVLNLGPFINLVKRDLAGRGLTIVTKIPSVNPTLALFSAKYLVKAQTGDGLRVLLVVGLIVAIAAFFSGPSVTAVRTRGAVKSGFNWVRARGERAGVSTGPVGQWTYTHRRALRIAAVAIAALVFVFWGQPTWVTALVIAIVLLLVLGVIELIGRPPAQPEVAGQPG